MVKLLLDLALATLLQETQHQLLLPLQATRRQLLLLLATTARHPQVETLPALARALPLLLLAKERLERGIKSHHA